MRRRPVTAGVAGSLFLWFLMGSLSLPATAQYGGGAGTPDNPYLIYTAEQLNAIGAWPYDWDKHFKVMADLDFRSYSPGKLRTIGTPDDGAFTGVFDGNHKIISDFRRSSDYGSYVGLFGIVDSPYARIVNVILVDPNIASETGRYLGALVGWLREGTVANCHVRGGSVRGESFIGGLVGRSEMGTVVDCTASAVVRGLSRVGGLVGQSYYGLVERCRTAGEVSGPPSSFWIGGLIGESRDATVRECRACCAVQGDLYVGGLIGESITAVIDRCCAAGAVRGQNAVGGLVGQNSGGTIDDSYATAGVTGGIYVGGLAGCNGPNCHCAVYTPGVISRCYAAGPVRGQSFGGLVGLGARSEARVCFWDIEATGCAQSSQGDGRTTKEMGNPAVYLAAGWDFVAENKNGTRDTWRFPIGGSYPRLVWELAGADFNGDGRVNLRDFGRLATQWRRVDMGAWSGGGFIASNGVVDCDDLKDFSQAWLAGDR